MELLNDGFDQPKEVSDLNLAFGGDMSQLLPDWESIPEEFKTWMGTDWNKFVTKWFFSGANAGSVTFHPEVGKKLALRHLKAIMVSFEPKHEHKEAGVAWLLSRWCESVTV